MMAPSMTSAERRNPTSLTEQLEANLPIDLELKYHHISVPPTQCADIFAPTPGRQPRKTYSESHSLTVSIRPEGRPTDSYVAIFAIELVLYTTAQLSTLFVSKADSTGFLASSKSSQGSGSVVRAIATTFISWLISCRHRPDRRLVLSLFARAQDQYLFPGSAENPTKHVLDDRALIKWWCKTLHPIVNEYSNDEAVSDVTGNKEQIVSKAYLIVPGLDQRETAALFPTSTSRNARAISQWVNDHPLRQIADRSTDPPRFLVPRFPDDPKARFLDDLDEELPSASSSQQQNKRESPIKRGIGHWKSIKTLEQFWEMMAHRQECSSGRAVGFIWITFTPSGIEPNHARHERSVSPSPIKLKASSIPPIDLVSIGVTTTRPKAALAGLIHSRSPRVKTTHKSRRIHREVPELSGSYYSPLSTRGTLVLDQKAYDRAHEVLLRLDFAGLDTAVASTQKWVLEVATIAGVDDPSWAVNIIGRKAVSCLIGTAASSGGLRDVNSLTVKKRKKDASLDAIGTTTSATPHAQDRAPVNILGSGLVRKKPRTAP